MIIFCEWICTIIICNRITSAIDIDERYEHITGNNRQTMRETNVPAGSILADLCDRCNCHLMLMLPAYNLRTERTSAPG